MNAQFSRPGAPRKRKVAVGSVFRVLTLVEPSQRWWFVLMIFVLCLSAAVTLGFGILLKGLVDTGFSNNDIHHLNKTLFVMLGMVALLSAASFARLAISGWLSEQIVSHLRIKSFAHLLGLDPSFYQKRHSGEVASSLSADLTTIGTVVATSLPMMVRHSLMAAGGFAMLVTTSPHLTMLVMVVLPLVAVPVIVIGRAVRRRSKKAQEQTGQLGGMVAETLSAIQTVQSYTAEDEFLSRFRAQSAVAGRAAMRQAFSRSAMVSSVIFVLFTALCVVMWVGAHRVMSGDMTAGALTSFVFFAGVVASALGVLGDMGAALFRAAAALERVQDILDVVPAIASVPDDVSGHSRKITGVLSFENLRFRYAAEAAHPALDGLNFTVGAGETVAVVGDSGAGKTTLFQLVMRFYDPEDGRILLDGRNIRSMPLEGLRAAISYVPQDCALFSGSVYDNITMGDRDAAQAEVEAAARDAMAHDFIMALPQGYDTPLGERGMKLSGGQRQRIALARALFKKAPVLLLDEATAALDSGNEKAIQEALKNLHGRRTVMIIAHRLSTVIDADRIYVIQRGRLVEQGSHAELLAQGGAYARMVAAQFSMAEDRARREYPDLTGSVQ